jgi:hypothetical protein
MSAWSFLLFIPCVLLVGLVIVACVYWSNRRWWPEIRRKPKFRPSLAEVLEDLDKSERRENRDYR